MRKSLITPAVIAVAFPAAALAQQGNVPGNGGYPDISKSDMGAHDSATMPNNLDIIRNGIRDNDMERTAVRVRQKDLGPARPAKAKELAAGATVNDRTGTAIATIVTIDPDGVVVASPTGKIKVPAEAFGHNNAGLLLDMTKADFDKIVAKANGAS